MNVNEQGFVYIIQFASPLGNARHSATYYVGWARNVEARLRHHRNGRGAAITRAAAANGIGMEIVFSMPGTRADERRIKNQKNTRRWLNRQMAKLAD